MNRTIHSSRKVILTIAAYSIAVQVSNAQMMYWIDFNVDLGASKIQRANLDGSGIEDLVTGLNQPQGLAIDPVQEKAYWVEVFPHRVRRADLDGLSVEDVIPLDQQPLTLEIDSSAGKLYWSDTRMLRANLDGTNTEILIDSASGDFSGTYGLALYPRAGKLYWTQLSQELEPQQIRRANLDGSGIEDLLELGTSATLWDIDLDLTSGTMYWSAGVLRNAYIARASLDGSNSEKLPIPGLNLPRSLFVDAQEGKLYWADFSAGTIQRSNLDGSQVENLVCDAGHPFRITLGPGFGEGPCEATADCADVNHDGLRDDGCTWWACVAGECLDVGIIFGDMGGAVGQCLVDGVADASDSFHALNCFSDQSTSGTSGYPCEVSPPSAYNVDAGGPFGDCNPDGVCDGNDAFHALNAFQGSTTCSCPSGPAPTSPQPPVVVAATSLRLQPSRPTLRPGETVEVRVLLVDPVPDLRGYQLHVAVRGGTAGTLDLVDIAVDDRKDAAFTGLAYWQAFNVHTNQMLAGLDTMGIQTIADAYLATFMFRASPDAAGAFTIELLHDDPNHSYRTFLFPTPTGAKIAVDPVTPAVVTVKPARLRAAR